MHAFHYVLRSWNVIDNYCSNIVVNKLLGTRPVYETDNQTMSRPFEKKSVC